MTPSEALVVWCVFERCCWEDTLRAVCLSEDTANELVEEENAKLAKVDDDHRFYVVEKEAMP